MFVVRSGSYRTGNNAYKELIDSSLGNINDRKRSAPKRN